MYIIHVNKISVEIEAMQQISTLDNLKARDYRVLFLLMGHIDGRTYRKVDPSRLAKELGLSKSKVKKSMKRLIDVELLEKGESEHVKEGYKFTF